jgi:ligand-binding sensor protein
VASLITDPDGLPLTRPSNFTRLCSTIIRKTETGLHDCYLSDKEYGALQEEGPMVRTCLGCGLWDAGTPIYVGGKHLANWLVGQVRDETQTEEQMIEYANKIGADPDEFIKAFYEVPVMTHEKFIQIADTLFVFSRQLSNIAYQNIQQAKFILQRKTAEEALKKNQYILTKAQEIGRLGTWEFDLRTGVLIWTNQNYENFGVPLNTPLTYELFLNCVHPDDREFVDNSWEQALEGKPYDLEHRVLIGDEIRWLREKAEIIFDESGKAEVAIGFTQDVTQWKLTEIELNDYKNSLEDQVKRRTHELEMKNIELERYNRLFVGREFRIKELKDQVAELKRQLADRSNRQ